MRTFIHPLTIIDGYKLDHRRQYPPNTTGVYSNLTPRSSRVPGQEHVVHFGLQAALRRYFIEEMERFFNGPRDHWLRRYATRVNSYLGFDNQVGTAHIGALHELGYLPLEVRAIPEGVLVPLRVPMFTIENTEPEFAWLTNYMENIISISMWLPCTSATTAMRFRRLCDQAARATGGDPEFVKWQGHDFSFRGMPGLEAAMMSGAAHLLSFAGTDTIPALDWIEHYYGGEYLAGSVNATEHSVMCAGGEEDEKATILRLLGLYPTGVLSVVSDTWDLWHVLTEILPSAEVREAILNRLGKYVTRPDSGNPADILCGDPNTIGWAARKGVIELLWDVFGGTTNAKGFRHLNPHVGAIYGDAITEERGREIFERLAAKRFASDVIVLGIGSYTYQYVTRDTYGFAIKATQATVDGTPRNLFKKPVTDDGVKFSAKGRVSVMEGPGRDLVLLEGATPEEERWSLLRPTWRDGKFIRDERFPTIQQRLAANVTQVYGEEP